MPRGVKGALRWLMNPKRRVGLGWIFVIGSIVGWPASLILTDEPKFILSLSWLAILFEGWNSVQVADAAEKS